MHNRNRKQQDDASQKHTHEFTPHPQKYGSKFHFTNNRIQGELAVEESEQQIEKQTSLSLLHGGATALKNFEVDETKRHETKGQTGHDSGE